MKKGILLVLLVVMVCLLGCEQKQTMGITGPKGQKATVTIPK